MEKVSIRKEKNRNDKIYNKKAINLLQILFCACLVMPWVGLLICTLIFDSYPNLDDGEVFGKSFLIIVSIYVVSVLCISVLGCAAAYIKKRMRVLPFAGAVCAAICILTIIIFNFFLPDVSFFFEVMIAETVLSAVSVFFGFLCFIWSYDSSNAAVRIIQIIITVLSLVCLPAAVIIEMNVLEVNHLFRGVMCLILLCVILLIVMCKIIENRSTAQKTETNDL